MVLARQKFFLVAIAAAVDAILFGSGMLFGAGEIAKM